jgi:photosystem II stability/assembly factor-like uncharacterized protein
LDARSGEVSPEFRARLGATFNEGRPASGLMQGVAVVAVVAITLGTVGVLLMSRGVRHAPMGSVNGPRYTVTTSLMAAKGGPLNACFAMPLPATPIGCGGVEVSNVDVASVPGVVTYRNGTVWTPIVKLVGTWDGHVFRLTEQPSPAKPGDSTEAKLVPQAPPIVSKESPQQLVEHLKHDTSDLQKRGIVVFAFGAAADGVDMTVAVADDKTVQYLYDRYGRVYIKGWLQPVGAEIPVPSPSPIPAIVIPTTAELIAPSRDVVWALIASGALFRSTDGGNTWEWRSLPLGSRGGGSPSFVDAQNGWYSTGGVPETQCNGAGTVVWRTTDGAATWQRVASTPINPTDHSDSGIGYAQCKEGQFFIDPQHGFLGAWDPNHKPTVYRTSDAGKSWSASTLPDPPGFVSATGGSMLRLRLVKAFGSTLLAFADANRSPAYVFRSMDGGVTWTYLATVNSGSIYPTFVTASRWLVIGNDSSGQETTDAGKTWHPFSTDYADAAGVTSTFVFADGDIGYGTVRGGIQRTIDGGSHWIRITAPALPSVQSVPDPKVLTARRCSSSAFDTTPIALGANYKIRLAPGWTDTNNHGPTESRMLELMAPASYAFSPTLIEFKVFAVDVHLTYGPEATAHSVADDWATTHFGHSALSIATSPADCSVAGEQAAVYGYRDGSEVGYRFYLVHKGLLYAIWLHGTGGIGDQAIQDALGMLSSIAWSV